MFSTLQGTITSVGKRTLTINLHGVGFEVFGSARLLGQAAVDQEVTLHTHLHVREDALELYGFLSADERDFFRQLISISGVGPKSALGVLSVASTQEVKQAVASGDASLLTRVSGIGRKTAERIVVELKEKLAAEVLASAGSTTDGGVLDALMQLGYTLNEAREALNHIPAGEAPIDERLKAALKALGKHPHHD
jgi:Holliday junction DNA helicase RuvA